MARHQRTQPDPEETVEVLNESTDIPDAELPRVGADPQFKGPAKALGLPQGEQGKVRYFRVVRGGYFMDRSGTRSLMREGKEIDNLNYDIRRLQQQAIKLEEIDPADRTGAIVY